MMFGSRPIEIMMVSVLVFSALAAAFILDNKPAKKPSGRPPAALNLS